MCSVCSADIEEELKRTQMDLKDAMELCSQQEALIEERNQELDSLDTQVRWVLSVVSHIQMLRAARRSFNCVVTSPLYTLHVDTHSHTYPATHTYIHTHTPAPTHPPPHTHTGS